MNRKQQLRLEVITRVQAKKMKKEEAAELLGISRRQIDNILCRYEKQGLTSIIHGNTGKEPPNKTRSDILDQIISLAGNDGQYNDFNVSHLQETLEETFSIKIGRSTLDRLLKTHEVRQTKRAKAKKRFSLRERRPAEGMMLQIDASSHCWLGERVPRFALLGAIDDARGKILYLEFRATEDQEGYLRLFRQVAVTHGLPMSYYHDRHTILQSPKKLTIEEELAGKKALSQLQRVLEQLGVVSIAASSPQAKGRVERLWGILQDRLIKEMRVAGIQTIEQANAFLPRFIERFNARFAQEPQDPHAAWVPLEKGCDLDYYFSISENRVVRNDHTIAWQGKNYLVLRERGEYSLARKTIQVHTTPEGKICFYDGKTPLRYLPVAQRPAAAAENLKKEEGKSHAIQNPKSLARRRAWLYAGCR